MKMWMFVNNFTTIYPYKTTSKYNNCCFTNKQDHTGSIKSTSLELPYIATYVYGYTLYTDAILRKAYTKEKCTKEISA